jgi:hypothetical protein
LLATDYLLVSQQSDFFFSSTLCDLLNEHLVDKGIGQRTRMERFCGATGPLKKRSSFRSAVVKRDEVMMKSNIEN